MRTVSREPSGNFDNAQKSTRSAARFSQLENELFAPLSCLEEKNKDDFFMPKYVAVLRSFHVPQDERTTHTWKKGNHITEHPAGCTGLFTLFAFFFASL